MRPTRSKHGRIARWLAMLDGDRDAARALADRARKLTRETPCTPERPNRLAKVHPSASEDGTCHDGCCRYMGCPLCGLLWEEELPQ